jgi:hypothetical protein
MIGHNNKGMQVTETSSVGLTQLFLNQAGYLRLPEVKRAVPSAGLSPPPSGPPSNSLQAIGNGKFDDNYT